MLTRPLTLNSDDRGRGLAAVTPPPALQLADEVDDDEETGTGAFSPPAPLWSPPSASPAFPPPPPPCDSSSSSFSPLTPPSFLSSASFTPPPPTLRSASVSPVFCSPSPSSLSSPLSSSSRPPPLPSPPPPVPSPSCTTPPIAIITAPSSVSPHPSSSSPVPPSLHSSSSSMTFHFVHTTPPVSPTPLPPPPVSSSPLPPPPVSSSPLPPPPPVSPTPLPPPPVSSTPLLPPPVSSSPLPPLPVSPTPLPPPPVSSSLLPPLSIHDSPQFPSAPLLPLLHHHSSLVSPPVFFTPHNSAIPSPLSCSSPPIPPSRLSPPSPSAPSSLPPAPPPCCPCSSLLPRLLSAHRLEVRRLLRGALASLGRRLDSLERRVSRRKMRKKANRQRGGEGGAPSSGPAALPFSSASSGNSASTSSSSSDNEDSPTPPLSSNLSQSAQRRRRSRGEEEEGEGRGKKRRRKNHRRTETHEEEEEDAGRFVGRMAVCVRGGGTEEEAPLTLHNFNHRKHRRREGGVTSQSDHSVTVIRRNGYTAPMLLHSSPSQNAFQLLQSAQSAQACSQSEALSVSSGQWRFSYFTPPTSLSPNHRALHLWLCSSSSFSPTPMLRLSAVAMETMSKPMGGGACVSPLRPLKDWTAPPSLSSDHCYVRSPTPSLVLSARQQQKQRANHSPRCLPRRRPLPLPPCSANGLSTPLLTGQSAASSEFLSTNGERGKRVSQIRIRRASPRETPLTPMGLPKVKRLKKKEFSLEEIYTNKNYKSPTTNRSLETIFEEPREKDGALLLIGQQRRRRLLLFPDFTQPRKRKRPQGAGLPVATVPRKRAAARRHCHGADDDESDLDVMLVERLSALEDFLTRQGLNV